MMAPPPVVANVQLRAKLTKNINRKTSAWKTMSLSRRDKVKNDSSQIFRSPSIYENNQEKEKEDSIMSSYLSGKLCPLTPSQQENIDFTANVKPEYVQKLKPQNSIFSFKRSFSKLKFQRKPVKIAPIDAQEMQK